MDHASFFSEAILIEIGVYIRDKVHKNLKNVLNQKCQHDKTSKVHNIHYKYLRRFILTVAA